MLLGFNYHLLTRSPAIEASENLIRKASWGCYGNNEETSPGLDFRGNGFTMSLRYSM